MYNTVDIRVNPWLKIIKIGLESFKYYRNQVFLSPGNFNS